MFLPVVSWKIFSGLSDLKPYSHSSPGDSSGRACTAVELHSLSGALGARIRHQGEHEGQTRGVQGERDFVTGVSGVSDT